MLLDSSQSSHIGSNIFKHIVHVGLLLMEALIQMVFCCLFWQLARRWNMMKYVVTANQSCHGGMQKLHHQAARLLPVSWLPLLVCYMYSLSKWTDPMIHVARVSSGIRWILYIWYTYIYVYLYSFYIYYISHTHTYIYIYIYTYSMLREKEATRPGFGCEIQAFALRCLAWKDTFTASLGDGFAFSKRLMPFNWGIIYK